MITFTLNDEEHTVDATNDMPLLWVIRDLVGLTGTKFGCGMGLCGACTVHLNGEPIRSCTMPVSGVSGGNITTIEHVGSSEIGKSVQDAWQEVDVPQCGYCQSGQIMSASALLAKNSKPTVHDINQAMDGNICRCGTYSQIRIAIEHAATNIGKISDE